MDETAHRQLVRQLFDRTAPRYTAHIDPAAANAIFAGMLGVSAMAVQNALVQVSIKGAPSTAVMTTNVTRFAMDLGEVLLRRDPDQVAKSRRAKHTWPAIVGFTIGFALQDIAQNFISGIMLLYRQPFNIGERVMVADYTGEVKEINVRDTVIETLDGELVIIPNREVFENPIVNLTHTLIRRRTIVIGLGYEQDADRAEKLFLDTIKSTPGVETNPAPTIRADSLGDSALMLEALFWINQQEHDFLQVHSRVVKAILRTAEENNINLPYPVQTVLLKNLNE